jgi:hypothetical protein
VRGRRRREGRRAHRARRPKTGVYLLDCDMDEHASSILRAVDAFLVHPFTGGTNPIDMHEVIMLADSATNMTNIATVDLGYQLEQIT